MSTSTADWWWEQSTCKWWTCSKSPGGSGLGNLPCRRGFLLQGKLPSWQVFGCTSTGIFAVQTRSKHWGSLVLPQDRKGKELSPWKLQAWKRFPPEALQRDEILQSLYRRERQARLTLSFDIIIPHQRKYFGITSLHIYNSEIKHLLSTLFKLYWGQILLSWIPTQLWRT